MDKNYSLLDEIKLKRKELAENEKLLVAEEREDALYTTRRLQRKSELTFIKKAGALKTQHELKIENSNATHHKSRSQYLRTTWNQPPTIAEQDVDLADNMPIQPILPSVLDGNHMLPQF